MFTSSTQASKARKSVAIASAVAMATGFAGLLSMGIASAAEEDHVVRTTMADTVVIGGETVDLSEITVVHIVIDGSTDEGTDPVDTSTSTTVTIDNGSNTTIPDSSTTSTTKPEITDVTPTSAMQGTTTTSTTKVEWVEVTPTTSAPASTTTVKPADNASVTTTTKPELTEVTPTTVKSTTTTTTKPTSTTAKPTSTTEVEWVEVDDETPTSPTLITEDDASAQEDDSAQEDEPSVPSDVYGDDSDVLENMVVLEDDAAPAVETPSGSLAYTGSDTFATLSIAFVLLGVGLSLLWYQMGRRERALS